MYEDQMKKAFAGMKADSGDDRVESFPAGGAFPAGVVVGTKAAGKLPVVAGKGVQARGISVHSHVIGDTFVEFDCASVMTKGLIWAVANGDCTDGGPVKFDAAGIVSNAATNALPNAVFRSAKIAGYGGDIALVELHSPLSVPVAP